MNRYHSFYLADLETKIREVAMAAMKKPCIYAEHNGESKDILLVNHGKAFYNEGVRATAEMIILALEKEAEEKDDTVRD